MKQAPKQQPQKAMGYGQPMKMADGGYVDVDDAELKRQMPGFTPPNSCDETQGPGVRSLQDYKK